MLQMDFKCIIIKIVGFYEKGGKMNDQVELLRNKLEKLISVTDSLIDSEIVSVSQELDKLIFQYYLEEYRILN